MFNQHPHIFKYTFSIFVLATLFPVVVTSISNYPIPFMANRNRVGAISHGRTTSKPYVVDSSDKYLILPLLTVGDEMPLLEGAFGNNTPSHSKTFAMAGTPDGLGVYETADSYYVFMNHEFNSTRTSRLYDGSVEQINGARVSLFQFTKAWTIVGGRNLVETAIVNNITYTLNLTTGNYYDGMGTILNESNQPNLSRFCSGYLGETGFVDENGDPMPLWFAPEEVGGRGGYGYAVYPNGTAVALTGLGKYAKEQVYAAAQYRATNADTTLILVTEDTSNGEIYLYEGSQTVADPNGFKAANGQLYTLRVEDENGDVIGYETMTETVVYTATWTTVPMTITLGSATSLSEWVDANGRSTNFRRPEDLHEDPNNLGTFYFVTTGHSSVPPGQSAPDNDLGKLYRFRLNPTDPTAPMPFELLLEGGPTTGVSYDNMTVDTNGRVLIQEDRTAGGGAIMANQERYATVLAYNIISDTTDFLFTLNQGVIDPAVATDYGNWESSGIIEVAPNPTVGLSSYLFDVQAHSLNDVQYVQGGQLVLAVPYGAPFRWSFPIRGG